MKILIVNFEYPPLGGGGGVATKQLAEALAPRHEVHVLTTWHSGLEVSELKSGIHIERVRVWGRKELPVATLLSMVTFVPAAIWRGLKLCQRQHFDVMNAQFVVPSGLAAVVLAKLFRVPLVISFIGGDVYDPTKGISPHRHWFMRALIWWLSRQARALTAISSDTKNRAQQMHGVSKPIEVVPLGLVPKPVRPASRKELGLPEDKPLFVSIGRLIPRKSYEMLLEAWGDVPRANLVIVGDGPLRDKFAEMIQKYGLKSRVRLLGFVSEERKLQILRAADGYVSAAEHEGFGIVFLEAMEAGLPIAAANIGGQTDFLTAEENALLVAPHEPKLLAAAVNRLIDTEVLRVKLAQHNREKVQNYYLAHTSAQFEKVLLKAADL